MTSLSATPKFIKDSPREFILDTLGGALRASDFLPPAFDKAIAGYAYNPISGYNIVYNFDTALSLGSVFMENPTEEIIKMCKDRKAMVGTQLQDLLPKQDKEALDKLAATMEKEATEILTGDHEFDSGSKDYLEDK